MTSKYQYAKADPLVYQRRVIEMRNTRKDDLFPCDRARRPMPFSADFSEKLARKRAGAKKAQGNLQPLNVGKTQRPAAMDMIEDYSSTAFSIQPSTVIEIQNRNKNNLHDTADFNKNLHDNSAQMFNSTSNGAHLKQPVKGHTPKHLRSNRKIQSKLNNLLDQFDSKNMTSPMQPKMHSTSIFNQTAVPTMSPNKNHDESTADSFLPEVGNRAHFVIQSPLDRKQRVLTIAKRITTRPETEDVAVSEVAQMTRRAALQILLGEKKNQKNTQIDLTTKKQKHERTKGEIVRLKQEKQNANADIDNQIDQTFCKESMMDERPETNHYSTIGGSTIGDAFSEQQSFNDVPRSPSSPTKRKKHPLTIDKQQQKSTELHFQPKVMQIPGGRGTSNYCLDIEEKEIRHLFSGGVTNAEFNDIVKNTTLHEPQISKVREAIQKQLKTGELQTEIGPLLVRNRGKGMHDFTVKNFADDYIPKTKKFNREKYAIDEQNIFMCEHAEDLIKEEKKVQRKPDDLISPSTNRKEIMLASKRIMVDSFSKVRAEGIIQNSFMPQDEENLDWNSSEEEEDHKRRLISSNTSVGLEDSVERPDTNRKKIKAQLMSEVVERRRIFNNDQRRKQDKIGIRNLPEEYYQTHLFKQHDEDSNLNKTQAIAQPNLHSQYPSFAQQEVIFQPQEKNHNFFVTAKGYINNKTPADDEVILKAYERYFLECNKNMIIPIPLFSKIKKDGVLSLSGKYISEGMAIALQTILSEFQVDENLVPPPFNITEVTFDDNGLTDKTFSLILTALEKFHPNIKKINYSNNEIGSESIPILGKIIARIGDKAITEIRFSGLQATIDSQYEVLKLVKNASSIKKLRLSNFKCSTNQRMIKKLKKICELDLRELNLSNNNLLAKDLNELMDNIAQNEFLESLTLSNNAVITEEAEKQNISEEEVYAAQEAGRPPKYRQHSKEFIAKLINVIKKSESMHFLDISNMNLEKRLPEFVWPIYHSKSLQAVHLSNNTNEEKIIQNLLFVFGIKTDETIIEMTRGGGGDGSENFKKQEVIKNFLGKAWEKPLNVQRASSIIANHDQICQIQDQKLHQKSIYAEGVGRGKTISNPLVLTRKLGHPELIFNEKKDKMLQFDKDAGPRWQLSMKDDCWISQKWKYAVIHYDSRYAQQQYTQIRDEDTIEKLKEFYNIEDEGVTLSENFGHPLIMASVTGFKPTRMATLVTFNTFCKPNDIDKRACKGMKPSEIQRVLLDLSQGIRSKRGKEIHDTNKKDAMLMFRREILPYSEKDMLLYCMPPEDEETPVATPQTGVRQKQVKVDSACSLRESLDSRGAASSLHRSQHGAKMESWMMDEYKEESFVYSTYLKPGKHTILIYDQVNDWWFFKEILADTRTVDIPTAAKNTDQCYSKIVQYKDQNNQTLIDLDNSVFMNFEHFSKSTVDEAFTEDSKFNRVSYLLNEENGEAERVMNIIGDSYETYCEFFQTVAASLDSFPSVKVRELPEFFMKMGLIEEEAEYTKIQDIVLKEMVTIRHPEIKNPEFMLNRTTTLEFLIVSLKHLRVEPGKDINLESSIAWVIADLMAPMLTQPAENVHITLTQFRRDHIWTPTINHMLFVNLEGIMQIYERHTTTYKGFTIISSKKVLDEVKLDEIKQIAKNVPGSEDDKDNQDVLKVNKILRQCFDLSQMIVLNEINARDEYLDTELMEFLEFLCRIAHVATLKHSDLSTKELPYRLKWLLQEMLSSSDKGYVEDKPIDELLKKEKQKLARLEKDKE